MNLNDLIVRRELSQIRSSYNFSTSYFFMRSMAENFIMWNAVIESGEISFSSKIMVLEHGICDHDLRKEIKILVGILLLFSIIVFNMINLFLKWWKLWSKSCIVQYSHQQVKLHIVSPFLQYKENNTFRLHVVVVEIHYESRVSVSVLLSITYFRRFEPRNTYIQCTYAIH